LQARTGAQLQVLVVDHVGDEGIEAYAQRVFDQWQLGREGVDDGVLLLVAVQDRRTHPDRYGRDAARIIDKAIVPRFRDGDLDQGLLDGTKIVVALIDGEDLPAWEAPSMRNVLPADWRSADSVVALTLLAGFLAGLWRSPPSAQAHPERLPAWARPLLVTAVVAAGCWRRPCGRHARHWQRSASCWRCAYRWRACLAGAGAAAAVCAWCCSACSGSVRGSSW
jgi:uncharacterized protein